MVLCSKQPCTPGCYKSLQLSKNSLDHFTAHLANGPTDPLVVELRKRLSVDESYEKLCLTYVIGSVAISGKADESGLRTMCGLCNDVITVYLTKLLKQLACKNDLDTIAAFVIEHARRRPQTTELGQLVGKLIRRNWNVMKDVAMRSLDILKTSTQFSDEYDFVLKQLPVGRQYKMIRTREVPLERIVNIYTEGDDLSLRDVFFLARCSHNPDPEIRACIADRFPFFKQSLADGGIVSSIASPCSDNIVTLHDDALQQVAKFMDIETLMLVMPLVCSAWRNLCQKVAMNDARICNLYLLDLGQMKLDSIQTILPWRWCLQDRKSALEYFGRCIEGGALGKIRPTHKLRYNVKEYLKAVMDGRTFLPRIGDCPTQYDAFTRLFEEVCNFCKTERPILGKPEFLTDGEYERAVYHFTYEKRWVLQLPDLMVVDDMPRLFSIIREDEKLMKELVDRNFSNYIIASFVLIVCGQTRKVPEKLARLIFSQTGLFEGLVEPTVVPCSEYCNSIVESGILPDLIIYHNGMSIFPRFLTCLILSFRDSPEMIDRIAASIASGFTRPGSPRLQDAKQYFEKIPFRDLMATRGYSAADFEFFKGAMIRCGLL